MLGFIKLSYTVYTCLYTKVYTCIPCIFVYDGWLRGTACIPCPYRVYTCPYTKMYTCIQCIFHDEGWVDMDVYLVYIYRCI